MDLDSIAGYKIEGILGEGGMGTVYRARDNTLERTLALKVIKSGGLGPDGYERFLREARACSRINHPNIVTVYSAGEENGRPYLAMELLQGKTLAQVLDEGSIPWEKALFWVYSILDAIDELHKEGIIHRDLKPDNMMITRNGNVKLMDFGIARLAESATLTQEGAVMGTAFYMSPEQVRGEKVDLRSDIFAMGCVLYQLLTGEVPFPGEQPLAVMYRIQNESPKPLSDFPRKFPEQLQNTVMQALDKDAGRRFKDAASFQSALAGIMKEEGIPFAQSAAPGQRSVLSLKLIIPVAVSIVVFAVFFSGVLRRETHGNDPEKAIQYNELGQKMQSNGDRSGAEDYYRKAIIADGNYALPWNNLGILAYARGDLAEADSCYLKAISIDSTYTVAMLNLATLRWDKNDFAVAEDFFKDAIRTDPSFVNAYNNYGAFLLQMNRAKEALEIIDSGLAAEPDNALLQKKRSKALSLLDGENARGRRQ